MKKDNGIIELTNIELQEVVGGGFFKDLGAACHELWNEVCSWFD